jgi:galactokinase
MDQFIAVYGRRDSALFLDCRSLAAEPVPLAAPDLVFAVCDSGVKHAHAGGEYNRRRGECADAVGVLRAAYPGLSSLRDLTPEQLEATRSLFRDPPAETLYRRARHVVTEIARVPAAVAAIRARDWEGLGALLDASHASLRDDYEVSVPEIDALVELARGVDGVLGARLMGGGFGGSTVTLLRRDALADLAERVGAGYRERTGREASIHAVNLVDGARVAPLGSTSKAQ